MDKLVEANQRALDLQYMLDSAQQEIERLRSQSVEQVFRRKNEEIAAKDARIKELQDLIDKPPEEADWVADYHLLQSALNGQIIDAARKWHAAYRKAQNSNLMRAKEVERLRSDVNHWKLIAGEKHDDMISWMNECKKKDARIKELETHDAALEERLHQELTHTAAQREIIDQQEARTEELKAQVDQSRTEIVGRIQECQCCMAHGESAYMQRLEAAFLRSNAAMRYYQEGNRGPWPQLGEKFKEPYQEKAREALKRIKEGGKSA